MKISNRILRFQDGGPMPENPEAQGGAPMGPEGGAPESPEAGPEAGPAGQGGPQEQLQQIAGQLVEMLMKQIGDPQAVMAVLQMAAQMVGQAGQQQAPTFQKCGGRLVRIR